MATKDTSESQDKISLDGVTDALLESETLWRLHELETLREMIKETCGAMTWTANIEHTNV
jgi:hypothetical protein